MFCPNCGTELPDDSVFCGTCGQRVDEEAGGVQQPSGYVNQPVYEAEPAPVQNNKKNVKLIGGLAAGALALIVIVVIAMKVFGGGSYTKPLNQVCKLLNNRDTKIEKYVDAVCPKFMVNAYNNGVSLMSDIDGFDEAMDEAKDELSDGFDDLKEMYGKDFKVKYEILDKDKMSKSDLKKVKSSYKNLRSYLEWVQEDGRFYGDIEDELDSSTLKKFNKLVNQLSDDLKDIEVTDGYTLEVNISIEGKEDDDDQDITVNVIKVNGKWCIDITSGDFNIVSSLLW
ncbi:zinc ribbon domain-containing protein [Clostridium sp. chh4-2]|uniref:zinc ribbon domain-containing protein n=1 Tax=Clostridium sp. chh4-2 TaxID=2067550 RepID=UPI0015E1A30D|nr:zinc ribbon domain-containing protein [Clostridium sp. chh4-2]